MALRGIQKQNEKNGKRHETGNSNSSIVVLLGPQDQVSRLYRRTNILYNITYKYIYI